MVGKPLVTNGVASICGMLPAVDLNHQSLLTANEIDDVGSDRFLADELEAVEPT